MFIQSSGDILTLVKAFAILWIALLTGWFIYYLAMTAREGYLMMRGMRERISKVDAIIDSVKEKIEHSTSYLLLIGEGIKKLVEVAKEYSGESGKKKKK
jgi:hypothetical protein